MAQVIVFILETNKCKREDLNLWTPADFILEIYEVIYFELMFLRHKLNEWVLPIVAALNPDIATLIFA